MRKSWMVMAMLMAILGVASCAPVLGAGAAIIADEAAEQQGGNLF